MSTLKVAAGSHAPDPAGITESGPKTQAWVNEQDRRLGALLRDLGGLDSAQIESMLTQKEPDARRIEGLAEALRSAGEAGALVGPTVDLDVEPAAAGRRLAPELAELQEATSESGETLRIVRSQLLLRWFGENLSQRSLAIVSPEHGDGRTYVCAALAVLIAQLDENVLVVDADLRRPRLHQLLQVDNSGGLATWLAAPEGRPKILAAPGLPRLHVLPAGPSPRNPSESLTRRDFGRLLGSLVQRYAFVLIDTPPALSCGEALTVAARSGGCLLVTRRHRSRVADAQDVVSALGKHGVQTVGAIVNEY